MTLVPPGYVRPYVRRNKTDRADAAAILEAVRSGQMPTVAVKRVEQQALVALHRVREQWMTTRTARINTLRGILREHGLLLPAGARAALQSVPRVPGGGGDPAARASASRAHRRARGGACDRGRASPRSSGSSRHSPTDDPVVTRLRTIPGIGLLTATALVGSVGHIHAFHRARQFASWLGLTPREHSSGPRRRLGGISKRGDVYLRCLLTHGARAVLLAAHRRRAAAQPLRPASMGDGPPRAARPQQSDDCGGQQIGADRLGGLDITDVAVTPGTRPRNAIGDPFHPDAAASDETHGPSVSPTPHQADSSPGV